MSVLDAEQWVQVLSPDQSLVQRMKDIRNYSTAVQIISGLNDVAIQRLKGLKEVRP